jgi:Fe(3+) dicitrate transport protein
VRLPVRRVVALLATTLLAAPALAADAADAGDQASETATIIVTAARDNRDLADVSGTLIFAGKLGDVVLLDDLPPIPNRNLRIAVAEIPGLLVSEVSNGSWASLSYRGLGEPHESWNLLTLQDAIPIVPDMYSYPAAYFIPPLDLVERIEFIRGAAGLLYGPQPGGAINYVMKGPRRDPGAEAQTTLTFGSFNARQGLLSAAASNGRVAADGFIQYAAGDGPRRVNSDSDQLTARLRGHLLGDSGSVTLALDYYQGNFGEPGGLTMARLEADNRAGSTPLDRIRLERIAPSLAFDWQPDDRTEVTARLFYSRFERESWRQAGGSFGLPTPAANVIVRQLQTFDTGGLDVRLRRDFGSNDQHAFTVGVLGYTSNAPVAVDKGRSNSDFEGTAGAVARVGRSGDAVAVFGEVRLDFGAVQIVPGFRFERLRQEVTETLDLGLGSVTGGPPGAPNGGLGSRSNVSNVPLWGIGATWDASDTLRFVFNASRGFKPLLYNDGVTFQAGVDAAGTFEASYSFTIEAAVQAQPIPALRLDAGLFRVTLDDQVGFFAGPLPASPPFGAVGAGGARRQNVGNMRNQGIDLAARLDILGPDGLAPSRDTLRLAANVQLLDAVFTSGPAEGFTPQYAPPYLMRATLSHLGAGGSRAALIVTSVGEQQGADNDSPAFVLPAYTVVDASIEVPIGHGISLGAGINNIFDTTYAARVRPGGGGGFDPGLPRNAYISIGWQG